MILKKGLSRLPNSPICPLCVFLVQLFRLVEAKFSSFLWSFFFIWSVPWRPDVGPLVCNKTTLGVPGSSQVNHLKGTWTWSLLPSIKLHWSSQVFFNNLFVASGSRKFPESFLFVGSQVSLVKSQQKTFERKYFHPSFSSSYSFS